MSSFRLVMALSAFLGLKVYDADINTAYLNAKLQIPQYVNKIEGFPCRNNGSFYIVRKALYGLRQAGREWIKELDRWMTGNSYVRCSSEPCLYYKTSKDGQITLVLVYVDDIVCATNTEGEKIDLFAKLESRYGIKDQGLLSEYLGVRVKNDDSAICITKAYMPKQFLKSSVFMMPTRLEIHLRLDKSYHRSHQRMK
ncbi:unnamed protein product [Peronospora belbahrii]|uniref:Reverse transcriptase Ty1/copia-type domain-containing protein n=1 Tax=Peronospora belbahrii TaxID=622444 RepID=A0AAU9KVT5_9STRA|nr:unnamed protein product [Peronospora belbahrii]